MPVKMPKQIIIQRQYPDDLLAALRGEEIDSQFIDQRFADEDVDVLKSPDGEPLALLRCNAVPADVRAVAHSSLRKMGRGSHEKRPYQGDAGGYFDCRATKFTASDLDGWSRVLGYVGSLDDKFRSENEALQGRYDVQRAAADRTDPSLIINGTAFSTITVNCWDATRDRRSPLHKDSRDLVEGFGVIGCASSFGYEGATLIFPAFRIGFDLRAGDVLLCDVHEFHCNAPLIASGPFERIIVVAYFVEDMVACGK
jgi:hypothetical protein